MDETATIRRYFSPIQPSVKVGQGNISYEEFNPPSRLQDFIHCYWQLRTHEVLDSPYMYRVVSDGCVDVFFNQKNTTESFIMGFCKKYTEFSIGNEFNYAGIRFYPSIFPQLFNISAQILKDKDQALSLILPQLASFISREFKGEFKDDIPQLDDFFISTAKKNTTNIDNRFNHALLHICKENGYLKTESELNFGLSPRQLRRLFNYYVGTTPKSFSQVVRFQYILNAQLSTESLKKHKVFFDVGFHDQAHFIKTFSKFYGVTPAKAFR